MSLEPLGSSQLSLVWKPPSAYPSLGCALQLIGTISAAGYAEGAAILVSTQVHVQVPGMNWCFLGSSGPVGARVDSYPTSPGSVRREQVVLVVPVTAEALNHLEERRGGGPITVQLRTTLFLAAAGPMPHGTASTREVQETMTVDGSAWEAILQQWGRGAAIPLFVSLPHVLAGDEQRTIVVKLLEAKRLMNAGRFKDSVAASREAVELLRGLSSAKMPLPKERTQRDLDQRRHAILDALAAYVQELFNYDSAAVHADAKLRPLVWERENALFALTSAAAAAQRVMSD
jgi:hypothetical protein